MQVPFSLKFRLHSQNLRVDASLLPTNFNSYSKMLFSISPKLHSLETISSNPQSLVDTEMSLTRSERHRGPSVTNFGRSSSSRRKGYSGRLSKERVMPSSPDSRGVRKSRRERVSRIKVIEPAHLTGARITSPRDPPRIRRSRHFHSHPRRPSVGHYI